MASIVSRMIGKLGRITREIQSGRDMAIGWSENTRRALRQSHLVEPKTKIGKLRALLPDLEIVLAGGQSQQGCVDFLKHHGLDYVSIGHFRTDLHRARKLGPLSGPQKPPAANTLGIEQSIPEPTHEPRVVPKSEGSREESAERREIPTENAITVVERVDGVLRTSTKRKTFELNTQPRLEDFL